jgi:membrane-associated protease RseP (regulator of RpoE activity)
MLVLSVLIALPLAVMSRALPTSAEDPRVERLIEQSGAALHAGAMRDVHVLHVVGKGLSGGAVGPFVSWVEIGGLRNAERYSVAPGLSGGSGFDGTAGWNLDQTGLVWVNGCEACRYQDIVSDFAENYDLWKPHFGGASVAYGGERTDRGRGFDVLHVTAPGSKLPIDVWIARKTHLPERFVLVVGATTYVEINSDFRAVDGLMLRYREQNIVNGSPGPGLVVTHVDVNPRGGAAHFAKPESTPHDYAMSGGVRQTSVPTILSDDRVYLPVMLDGKGPYEFLFDTTGQNAIDPAVARAIGAKPGDSTSVRMVTIGAATMRDQLFAVGPVRDPLAVIAGLHVDGIIGWEVLSRFVTTFDYVGHRAVFRMPGTGAERAQPGADVLPVAINFGTPQIPCTIVGIVTACTISNAASHSIALYAPFVREHPQVVPSRLSADGVDEVGQNGRVIGKLGRLRDVAVGRVALRDLIVDVTSRPPTAYGLPFVGGDIGGPTLARFSVTFDYPGGTLTLVPNGGIHDRDVADRSGLFLLERKGVFTVAGVRPGTTAMKAGLAPGDAIVAIDGKRASSLTLARIRQIFREAPGSLVTVRVRNTHGTMRTSTFTLRDVV